MARGILAPHPTLSSASYDSTWLLFVYGARLRCPQLLFLVVVAIRLTHCSVACIPVCSCRVCPTDTAEAIAGKLDSAPRLHIQLSTKVLWHPYVAASAAKHTALHPTIWCGGWLSTHKCQQATHASCSTQACTRDCHKPHSGTDMPTVRAENLT
jgi:hypothetical protein